MRALCLILVLTGLATSAFARVDYVRDFNVPGTFVSGILSASQSPITDEGTYRIPDAFSWGEYAPPDVNTGMFEDSRAYPDFSYIPATVSAWVGQSSTGTYSISITNRQIRIFSIDRIYAPGAVRLMNLGVANFYQNAYSVAALSLDGPISFLADTGHYTVDSATGEATTRPLAGVDTATTRFMAYGADGLLYVLDYGHERIAAFDPNNAFAPIESFTLTFEPGIPVANTQFAIGATGSFYLTDGLGGGSYYNRLGEYQARFTLSGDAVLHPYTGASFINTDAEGNVFVYDSAKGMHQFHDNGLAPVPEPSTYAAAIGALLGALVLRRRWQRA